MKDLIDRQAAIDTILSLTNCSTVRELYEYIQEHQLTNYWTGGINDAIDAVIGVPSAQPEIIHCRECDYWIPGLINDNDDFIPPKCGKYQQMVGHSANDYCSYAEREEA